MVQLGDSIASGEGTLYGYTWDATSKEWTGGNVDYQWPPPYPDCHVSQDAYGNAVAEYFGATLTQFACSGATFADGIAAPETDGDAEYRPAEFGNWDTQTDLNPEYDSVKPQVVLVTLGADDLQFSAIVEDCIKNAYYYYFGIEDLRCVKGNPGTDIQQDFFDFLPTLKANYATLVKWIKARAVANGVPAPKIVFTNYANPIPADGTVCNDTNYLYKEQLQYLSSLVDEANEAIEDAINGLADPDVAVADISGAYEVQGRVAHLVLGRAVGVRPVDLLDDQPVVLRQQGAVPPDARWPGEHRRARRAGAPPLVPAGVTARGHADRQHRTRSARARPRRRGWCRRPRP